MLPAPERTTSGYRVYDGKVLQRLAFIGRAKQLGCSLQEIADLSVAWDGGECGPIQDHLRPLVASKLAAAQRDAVELATFTDELRRAAVALERHRPVGPCDEGCGCVNATDVPIACTLSPAGIDDRLAEWQRLLEGGEARTAIPGGARVTFGRELDMHELSRLCVAEQECCRFFSFAVTVDERGIGLEVTAPAEAMEAVRTLVGV